jgi:hypothetical protein
MSQWWWREYTNQKPPHLTKKERKAIRRKWLYNRRMDKWRKAEPPLWRIFARWRWKRNEPKMEG